jgi:hypothetical protein
MKGLHIAYMLLLLIAIVGIVTIARLFIDTQEGFSESIGAYKSSSGYKKEAAAVVALADSRSNGRRDIMDMLASAEAPPSAEQCFVNFYSLGCRFSGYLGPFVKWAVAHSFLK